MIRVMLVDDSVIIRSLMSRMLKGAGDIDIVAMAGDGREALDKARDVQPDIILLDLEMPVMDGLSAIPLLLQACPRTKIILCSALSEQGADITLKGLSLGASDFILKPSALTGDDNKEIFRNGLLARIYTLAQRSVPAAKAAAKPLADFNLREERHAVRKPAVIAIGSSTGGPHALMDLFSHLKPPQVPLAITQHMPKTFTKILAEQLTRSGAIPCHEGAEGMEVLPGHAYVAPGDYHMIFSKEREHLRVRLNQDAPENFCRPAVDPMMRSLMGIFGGTVLGVILTGMGSDGLNACRQLAEEGGVVIAQDEASAAVWGMPGAVARAGLCSMVAPVPELASRINQMMGV